MKIATIFILTQGAAAQGGDAVGDIIELKLMADDMLAAPAFDMLSDGVKRKWANRFHNKMFSRWLIASDRCVDASQ